MMTTTLNRLATAVVLAGSFVGGSSALADTELVSFDAGFALNSIYGSWNDPNVASLVSGPTSFEVESLDFGGGFHNIVPDVDATGETTIEFDVTVNSTSLGNMGVVLALGDSDFTEWNYGWWGLTPGNHVLTATINSPTWQTGPGGNGIMDLNAMDYIHIQADPGGANSYSVSYNNLRLIGAGAVPEPTSLALLTCGVAGVLALARRRR